MVKGPDAGKDVKGRGGDLLFGCDKKMIFVEFQRREREARRGKLRLGIANSQIARGRGFYV